MSSTGINSVLHNRYMCKFCLCTPNFSKKKKRKMETQSSNLDLFCKFCGTLVPIRHESVLKCPLCQQAFSSETLENSEITVNVTKTQEETTTAKGSGRTIINERCPECGKEGLYFTTAQIRSADEGQTIFYECIHCHYKYSQNA